MGRNMEMISELWHGSWKPARDSVSMEMMLCEPVAPGRGRWSSARSSALERSTGYLAAGKELRNIHGCLSLPHLQSSIT